MDPLLGELAAELAGIEPTKLKLGVYSSVDQDTYYRAGHEPIHREEYWIKDLRHSVYFTNAVRLAVGSGHTTFVELAPNPVALMSGRGHRVRRRSARHAAHPDAQAQGGRAARRARRARAAVRARPRRRPVVAAPRGRLRRPFRAPRGSAKPYWVETRIDSSGNTRVPGAHVSLPDGRHVWEVAGRRGHRPARTGHRRRGAGAVGRDARRVRSARRTLRRTGTLTTTLNPHPGGASVQVHARRAARVSRCCSTPSSRPVRPLPEPVVAPPVQSSRPVGGAARGRRGHSATSGIRTVRRPSRTGWR